MSAHDHQSSEQNMSAEEHADEFSTSMFFWVGLCTALFAGAVIIFILP